jgi:broad specificity phosphatase PhoE
MKAKPSLKGEEERIREIEFGILDGPTTDGMIVKYPEEFCATETGKQIPVSTSWRKEPSRCGVASFLGTLIRDYREKSALVVCHSVVVLVFRWLLERWDEEEYMKIDAEDDVLNCNHPSNGRPSHRLQAPAPEARHKLAQRTRREERTRKLGVTVLRRGRV